MNVGPEVEEYLGEKFLCRKVAQGLPAQREERPDPRNTLLRTTILHARSATQIY
jgi:hypothetical protein